MDKGPTLKRLLLFFGSGVLGQALLSGANFLIGLIMIRYATDAAYGQLVLAQSAVLLVVSAQGAWMVGPLLTTVPRKSAEVKQQYIGAMRASQARFLRWAAAVLLLGTAGACAVRLIPLETAAVVAAIVLAAWAALQREYLRGVFLTYSRPHQLLQSDAVYALCLVLGVSATVWFAHSSGVAAICALVAGGCIAGTVSYRIFGRNPGWVGAAADAGPIWREIRPLGLWSTVGAVLYWLFAQSYSYVLANRLNLAAVAGVNAAALLLKPVFLFTQGINNVLMSLASNWLAQFGLATTLRRLALVVLAVTALDLLYMVPAWEARDWLVTSVLHKNIANRDQLLLLWGWIALVFLPREILQAILFALHQVRSMTWIIAVSAPVSLSLMWFGTGRWGSASALIGQMAGELVNICGLIWLLWRHVRVHGFLPPSGQGHA